MLIQFFLMAAVGAMAATNHPAPVWRVISVHDGDTITVTTSAETNKVRLIGVDCPELGQPLAKEATDLTAELCLGQIVTLRKYGVDKYGRILADVILSDGRSLSQELLVCGLAKWYKGHGNDKVFEALEKQAKADGLGLWVTADETAAPKVGVPKKDPPLPARMDNLTGETTKTGLPIYEGPRGGHYHYSKSGKKVYEKK